MRRVNKLPLIKQIQPQNRYPKNKQWSFLLCNSPYILFLWLKLFSEFGSESHSICVTVTQRRSSTSRLKKLSFLTFEVVMPVTGNIMWHHVFWYISTKLCMLTQCKTVMPLGLRCLNFSCPVHVVCACHVLPPLGPVSDRAHAVDE